MMPKTLDLMAKLFTFKANVKNNVYLFYKLEFGIPILDFISGVKSLHHLLTP